MAHTLRAFARIQDNVVALVSKGTEVDRARDRNEVCALMLDAILWFGFGAILIFPYGVYCGAKWSGGYKG